MPRDVIAWWAGHDDVKVSMAALSNWRSADCIRPARRFYPALKVSLILSKFNRHLPLYNTTIRFAGRQLNIRRSNVKK